MVSALSGENGASEVTTVWRFINQFININIYDFPSKFVFEEHGFSGLVCSSKQNVQFEMDFFQL